MIIVGSLGHSWRDSINVRWCRYFLFFLQHLFQSLNLQAVDSFLRCWLLNRPWKCSHAYIEALTCTHRCSRTAPQSLIFDGNLHFFLPSTFIVVLSHLAWTQSLKSPLWKLDTQPVNNPARWLDCPCFFLLRPAHPSRQPTWQHFSRVYIFQRLNK